MFHRYLSRFLLFFLLLFFSLCFSEGPAPADIDMKVCGMAGDTAAPVVLVSYICSRCPFCAKVTPPLVRAVEQGELKGRVRIAFKALAIKQVEHSVDGARVLHAARLQKKYVPCLLEIYRNFDDGSPGALLRYAAAVGIDTLLLKRDMMSMGVEQELVDIKKEGYRNDVKVTPTYFINGRKYAGEMTFEALVKELERMYSIGNRQ